MHHQEQVLGLTNSLTTLGVTIEDLNTWQTEQGEFFSSLSKEPTWNVHAVAYVELLQQLWITKYYIL